MKKQVHLEAMRGLAALLVVFCHYFSGFYPRAVFGADSPQHSRWEPLLTHTPLGLLAAGGFAVCLFFILSGYVLSLPYFGAGARDTNHLLAAVVKRPFRLVGLVLAAEIISLALARGSFYSSAAAARCTGSAWLAAWKMDDLSLGRLLDNPFTASLYYDPPLWTIQVELYGSFLTFGFLLLFRQSRWRYWAYLVVFGCLHAGQYQGFIIGIFCADLARNRPDLLEKFGRSSIRWALLVIGLALGSYPIFVDPTTFAGTFYAKLPHLHGLGNGWCMAGAILVFAAVMVTPELHGPLAKPAFAFLGRISYALYVIHFLVLASLSCWLFVRLQPVVGYDADFLITLGVSLPGIFICAWLLSRWVDDWSIQISKAIARGWLASMAEPSGL